ncbi:N-acetylmuramoyl-L-alanine amidase (modular protein) [Methylacidimicrobium sp. AP8]|uniref:N-acetylmuramoyl-L-alanine amidase family protein n=1 Tax=Methylacidimicrobium sp. AP8 TaxID=2730359 RepID=UPI0018C0C423|nr:N-acetylmuramoyl-L-alanine amidase [Methylacidimicrobium sp. AP8]CAB4242821.1 N-acetylmuramoyl-L-alanine amidase (modular protein) [Methylacidimicrobium sp. AP8]
MRCLLAGLAAAAGCLIPAGGFSAPVRQFSTVLLDPGHGGTDNGGMSRPLPGGRLLEKDLALDTASRVARILRAEGFRVVMTRTDDRFVDLDERVKMANRLGRGAVAVSIHYNATGDRSIRGAETYFWHADSHGLATRIERRLAAVSGESRRGAVIRRRLRLTRNPTIPAVLVECAYLTNAGQARLVAQPEVRERIARAIAEGIAEEARFGDEGIAAVPEIWAPLSRASDARSRTAAKHSHRKRHGKRRAKVAGGGECGPGEPLQIIRPGAAGAPPGPPVPASKAERA